MERYQFDKEELAVLESSCIPLAAYQFLNPNVVTLALSQGFLDLFGYEDRAFAYELMDGNMYRDTHPDDVARVTEEAVLFAKNEKPYNVIYRTRRADGYHIIHAFGRHEIRSGNVQIAFVWYVDEGLYRPESGWSESGIPVIREFTNDLQNESGMIRQNFDFLTGLAGMSYFFELAEARRGVMIARGIVPAVLYIDTTGMHSFNQKYGYAEGDRLIRAVGNLLSEVFGSSNCGRFGKDHFAVLTDAAHVKPLLNTVFEKSKTLNRGLTLPLRAGVYVDDLSSVSISTACDRAKVACNLTRKAYYSHFRFFNEDMLRDADKRQYIIENLPNAIRNGWIQVYYQPIVRAANGRICEEEALARWVDPERGMISPGDFISILEDVKLITQLDLFVLDRVLEKMAAQAASGMRVLPVSVNLSRVDFETCDIVAEVTARVDAAGIERKKLIIELTESVVGADFGYIQTEIDKLRASGFCVWMDDFGTGYSSLDVLQSVRFDLIKLDMRLLQKSEQKENSGIVLTELVKMISELGMETVAEGVETEEQVEFLREIGCTKLQGYYFCRPLPIEELQEKYGDGLESGFENPDEAGYYTAIGRISLYDLSDLESGDTDQLKEYSNAFPMAILESGKDGICISRCNRAFRSFMQKTFLMHTVRGEYGVRLLEVPEYQSFRDALKKCCADGILVMTEERTETGTVRTMIQRIAVNPVTGTAACRAVILKSGDSPHEGPSYASVAQALTSDYFNLYYVDLETGEFIEYGSVKSPGGFLAERKGKDFFNAERRAEAEHVYPADHDMFLESFSKERVMHSLMRNGTFALTYRRVADGDPLYVSLKAVRMDDGRHLIIGLNNVDAQMRHREALERIREERVSYSRIMALSGDYICIYSVDLDTEDYTEYDVKKDGEGLRLPKTGTLFFQSVAEGLADTVVLEDREWFRARFRRDRILKEIRESGWYSLNYRILFEDKPVYVCARGALVEEKTGPVLLIGIVNTDAQVRRDQAYALSLAAARSGAHLDTLTGVKNRQAYRDAADELDRVIRNGGPAEFAVAVCGIVSSKEDGGAEESPPKDGLVTAGCGTICRLFRNSPVFRTGEDEFVAILQNSDYRRREELKESLTKGNRETGDAAGYVVACGIAEYRRDAGVSEVYRRAEERMRAHRDEIQTGR